MNQPLETRFGKILPAFGLPNAIPLIEYLLYCSVEAYLDNVVSLKSSVFFMLFITHLTNYIIMGFHFVSLIQNQNDNHFHLQAVSHAHLSVWLDADSEGVLAAPRSS